MSAITRDITVTIANGQSLSSGVYIGGEFALCGIAYPAAWDAADITFQKSWDGVTYTEHVDDAGAAIQKTVTAGQDRELDAAEFKSAIYFKIRSGTSGVPVAQTAARTFTLHLRRYIAR